MASAQPAARLTFESANQYWDALVSLALARFVGGEQPYVQELEAAGVGRAADLVPIGSLTHHVTEQHADRVLAEGQGWTVLVQRYRSGRADVAVSAVGPEVLAKTVADVRARCPVPPPAPSRWSSGTARAPAPRT